jgi:hypothetical protein
MKILKVETDQYDIEDLACKILGLDPDGLEGETEIIEGVMRDDLDIEMDTFQEIVNRLLPLIDVGKSELTGGRYKGFSDSEKQLWLVKTKI